MGRLDFESGRFSADYETNEIARTLRGWQTEFGDNVLYYRYWGDQSEVHDIWDEATGVGRVWHPPHEIEVLHVTRIEGAAEDREHGLYYNDSIYVTASFRVLSRLGMTELDLQHQTYLRDRLVYDFRVFRVSRMQITGQIQKRDLIVSIEGSQVKPDEMLNDVGFEAFANATFPEKP